MINIIDFHTHILPEMDDGAKDVAESVKMLEMMRAYGVNTLIATPHFYPERDNPDRFLMRRNASLEKLETDMDVRLGAEVAYFFGISKSKQTERFCIAGTNHILIEMPFMPWTQQQIEEVINIKRYMGLNPILAHTERYRQKRGTWIKMKENDILLQSNASFFEEHPLLAKKYLHSGFIDLLGTDCHNCDTRKPNMDIAFQRVEHEALEYISDLGSAILGP